MTTVIFDLDGVLVDSEPLWQQGFAEVVNNFCVEQGRDNPGLTADDMHRFHGGRVRDTVRTLVEEQGLGHVASDDTLAVLTERVVEDAASQVRDAVTIAPSVDVASRLHADGVRMAVASSSAQRFIDAVVQRLGLSDAFTVTQSALELEHGKPDPEVYRLTLERLGAKPDQALAIEDSVPGVQAAARAGIAVVWLTPQSPEVALAQLDAGEAGAVKVVAKTLDYDEVRRVMKELG